MTKALDHKKTMLEELAYLDARSYFSRPKTAIHDGRPKMRRRE